MYMNAHEKKIKLPTKKKLLSVLEETEAGIFLTVCKVKKKCIAIDLKDLFAAVKIYQTNQAEDIYKFLKETNKSGPR